MAEKCFDTIVGFVRQCDFEQLAMPRHGAERLLQVMRRTEGELGQLLIGPSQLGRPPIDLRQAPPTMRRRYLDQRHTLLTVPTQPSNRRR